MDEKIEIEPSNILLLIPNAGHERGHCSIITRVFSASVACGLTNIYKTRFKNFNAVSSSPQLMNKENICMTFFLMFLATLAAERLLAKAFIM
jgi:hypothetical protein